MNYYRYRAPSEVSFKELIYDEIYFSSTSECNDPFDSKTFFHFPSDTSRWEKLLKITWSKLGIIPNSEILEIAKSISSLCPTSYEDVPEKIKIAIDSLKPKYGVVAEILGTAVQNFIGLYRPRSKYFVSFSKSNNEPLMWSHYAGKYEGFCLIFQVNRWVSKSMSN